MPNPSKPYSAQARAQGLGNNPNKLTSGDNNQREVKSISSFMDINSAGPTAVLMNGAQPSDVGGFNGQFYSLQEGTTEQDVMNYIDALDAAYAKNHPGFKPKPWTEKDKASIRRMIKKDDKEEKKCDSAAENIDKVGKGAIETKGKNNQRGTKCDSTMLEDKIDNIDKGALESKAKNLIGSVEATKENKICKPTDEQMATKPDSNPTELTGNSKRHKEFCKKVGDLIKAALATPDPTVPYIAVILEGRLFVFHEGVTNDDIDEFVAELAVFVMKKEDGFHAGVCEDDQWNIVIKKLTLIASECEGAAPARVNEDGTESEFAECRGRSAIAVARYNGIAPKTQDGQMKEGSGIGTIEPNAVWSENSNQVDEYEEVDGFNPHNIKCKCVIS